MSEDYVLKLKRASVWGDLYVAGKSLIQIAELFLVSIYEVRKTLWEAGFNFVASIESKRAVWAMGAPAIVHRTRFVH